MNDRLYHLLPAIYRIRDAQQSEQLRALLGIIEEQSAVLEQDIAGLYDDWFIETCAEWVIPYIGDLLGVNLLHAIESNGTYSQRAFVAHTLSYRRRKGTLLMLEDLASDVTGWRAHAVAFFELLGWTQNLNHQRFAPSPNPGRHRPEILNPNALNRVGTVNLRGLDEVDRLNGPFEIHTHTVDIRPPGQHEGWYHSHNMGVFVWRLQSYPMREVTPVASEDYGDGFYFSPLGNPVPLFTNPRRKDEETTDRVTEVHVPGQIRPVAFFHNPEQYYGADADKSLGIYTGKSADPDALIPPERILCKNLSTWSPPPPGMVAIDVGLGRFAFAPGETPPEGLTVTYHRGFSADIGGGPYDRRTGLEQAQSKDWIVTVAKAKPEPAPPEWRTKISDAIDDWDPNRHPRALITIADNGTYDEEISLSLLADQHLIIQAANYNTPTVRFRDAAGALSKLTVTGGKGEKACLAIDGLMLEGGIQIDARSLGRLELIHSTLVPGWALNEQGGPRFPNGASLEVAAENAELEVVIKSCITGPLHMPGKMASLYACDSIIDHPEEKPGDPPLRRVAIAQAANEAEPGPPTKLERVTIFGEVHAKTVELASEVIFTDRLTALRRQTGCVRYSTVEDLVSLTPSRYRCQPDLSLAPLKRRLEEEALSPSEKAQVALQMDRIRSRMRPKFKSTHYGHPGYAQLSSNTAQEIHSGSESRAEIGVFEKLRQPQRLANLSIRLAEYLPYGLDAAIIYVN
jgi:hypothetical protein